MPTLLTMSDTFKLPIEWNGQEHEYPVEVLRYGYTHKVQVGINNVIITFEPDEEGIYRALVPEGAVMPKALLAAISESLQFLFS